MEKKANTTNQIVKYSQSKPFYKKDLLLYGAVGLLIILLFVFLVIVPKTSKPMGFSVSIDNQTLFTFDFSTEEITIERDLVKIVHDKDNHNVTVYVNDSEDYNVISYDCDNYTVRVTESSCSTRDCVNFFEINSGNGVIYCLPHGLKILPLSPTTSEPSTGGML